MELEKFFFFFISNFSNGLEKLSMTGLDGKGAMDGNLFLSGETLPSGNKMLVSLDDDGVISCNSLDGVIGSQFLDKIVLFNDGKSLS